MASRVRIRNEVKAKCRFLLMREALYTISEHLVS